MLQVESQDSALCSKGGAEVPQKRHTAAEKEPAGTGPMGRADGQEGHQGPTHQWEDARPQWCSRRAIPHTQGVVGRD